MLIGHLSANQSGMQQWCAACLDNPLQSGTLSSRQVGSVLSVQPYYQAGGRDCLQRK
jgi:hypothetical protein